MEIQPSPSPFQSVATLIVKVTRRCNLDCAYCYEDVGPTGQDMSLATFKELAFLALSQTQSPELNFLFHGGEPSLLPMDWYAQALDFARQRAEKHQKKVFFSMQTNLLALSEAKMRFFAQQDLRLGISLDGPSEKGEQRAGSDKVLNNYLKAKALGLKMGILSTINASNFDRFDAICQWLPEVAQVWRFKANVVSPVGRAKDQDFLPAASIFYAQTQILEAMYQSQGRLVEENLARALIRYFEPETARQESLCHQARCGAGTKVLGISPQGHLLPCGRFEWQDETYFLGHLQNMEADFYHTKLEHFHQQAPQNWYHCSSCSARKICNFGCQAFILRNRLQANVECLPTKICFDYLQANEERFFKLYQIWKKPRPQPRFKVQGKTYTWPQQPS